MSFRLFFYHFHSSLFAHMNIFKLGWLSDPMRTAIVFEYCSRGSLQDVLIMDDIKLDWSFRLSLLTDLVRGMRYLHSSPMRVHGKLTSRNCVVDARWVLKITDYGLNNFNEAQGYVTPAKTAKRENFEKKNTHFLRGFNDFVDVIKYLFNILEIRITMVIT